MLKKKVISFALAAVVAAGAIPFAARSARAAENAPFVKVVLKDCKKTFDSGGVTFSQGLAYAMKGGKYGFINEKGEVVIDFIYDNISMFDDKGMARVVRNNADGASWVCGYVDKTGKEVIPLEYSDMSDFNAQGYAMAAKNGKYGVIDRKGAVVVPFEYTSMATYSTLIVGPIPRTTMDTAWLVVKDDKGEVGVINKDNKTIVPFGTYTAISPNLGESGVAIVQGKDEYDRGVIDITGEIIVPLGKYNISRAQEVERLAFSNGVLAVYKRADPTDDWVAIIIDDTGTEVAMVATMTDIYGIAAFNDGYMLVYKKDGSVEYVNTKGQVVYTTKKLEESEVVSWVFDGLIMIFKDYEKDTQVLTAIDITSGKIVIPESAGYYSIVWSNNNGKLVRVEKKVGGVSQYGLMDTKTGGEWKVVVSVEYDDLGWNTTGGFVGFTKGDTWGLIYLNGDSGNDGYKPRIRR